MSARRLMEIAGAVNYWLDRSGRAMRVYDHGDGAAEVLGVERVPGQLGDLYRQMFKKGYVRVAILHAQREVMVDYRGAMSRPQWSWVADQAYEDRLRIVNDQGHTLADYTESRKKTRAKDWLMSEEPPLYVEPDKTNPMEHLSHTIGTDEDFIAIDYHVFPDLSVQLHAAVRTEHFIQDFMEPVRVPESDALEQARQFVDAALEWMVTNDMGPDQEPEAWRVSQQEGNRLIDAIGRELDPDYDHKKKLEEAGQVVAALIDS